MNDYDVTIEEAATHNTLTDSVQQLRVISDLACFKNVPFIVFFNKFDLLPEKLKKTPLNTVFRDYEDFARKKRPDANAGKNSEIDLAIEFFKHHYMSQFQGTRCDFYTTCALDQEICKKVWNTVFEFMMDSCLDNSSLKF